MYVFFSLDATLQDQKLFLETIRGVEEWLCLITVEIQLKLSELRVFLLLFSVFKVWLSLLNCKFFYTVEIQLQFSELPVFFHCFVMCFDGFLIGGPVRLDLIKNTPKPIKTPMKYF